MRLTKCLAWGLTAGALAFTACSGAEPGPPVAAAQGVSEDPTHAHLGLLREALDQVSLRPDQKAEIEHLATAAKTRHESIRAAHVALRGAVADQVLSGQIDRALLRPQIDALVAATEQAHPGDRAALVRLHDLLDRPQREQLVNAVEAAVRVRMRDHKGHGPRQWAADLNLTDQQRDQIHAVLRDRFHRDGDERSAGEGRERRQAAHERGRRLMQSFREEKFTLDAAAPFGRDKVEHRIDRMLDLATVALPILRPEQRAIAAQKIKTEAIRH